MTDLIADLAEVVRLSKVAHMSAMDSVLNSAACVQFIRTHHATLTRIIESEAEIRAELEKAASVLPGTYYMDPPDGGDVSVSEQLRRMAKDAARWRFLCDECTHSYGDGYTEPNECCVNLEWQQGPWIRDGSNGGMGRSDTFPGWDSILDEAMEKHLRELSDDEGDDTAAMHDSALDGSDG